MDEIETINGIIAVYDERIYFLSNKRGFDGEMVPGEMRDEADVRYSWAIGWINNVTNMRFALLQCGDAQFSDIKQVANRVNLTTTNLKPWDYCPVIFRRQGINDDLGMLVVSDTMRVFILSNSLEGAHISNKPIEFNRYTCSWLATTIDSENESFGDVMCTAPYQVTERDITNGDTTQPTPRPQNDTPSELMNKNYQQEVTFEGMRSYHAHHGCAVNLPLKRYTHRIGVELEVEFPTSTKRDTFTNIKTNWFYCERDGSLGSNGCEIITIPLHPNDAKSHEFWEPLCDTLTSLGAKSWDTSTCGCHVHIGREILGKDDDEKSQTLGKLLYFYHEFLKDALGNCKIYGRTHGYHDTICKTDVSSAVKILGSSVLKDKEVREKLDKSMKERSLATRYFDINVMNSATIEFRKGRGSLNPKRIAMIVEWSELIVSYAKFTHWKNISMETFKTFIKMKSGLSTKTMNYIEDYFD